MRDQTTYEKISNFLLDNWIIAIIVLITVIIAFIPSLRDGTLQIVNFFKRIKREKEFIIEHHGEKITFELNTRSSQFDIVKINAITHHLGVNAEYKWIKKYYPEYNCESQSFGRIKVDEERSLYYDIITIEDKKGNKKAIYFDISEFYNDGGHTSADSDKFARAKIKEQFKTNNGA